MVDYKQYLKSIRLSGTQRRLFNALTLEPTSHLYSRPWQRRHHLTSGGTQSALRRLVPLGLVAKIDGIWRIADPGMEKWWTKVLSSALGTSDSEALSLQFKQSSDTEAEITLPPELLELARIFKEIEDRARELGIYVNDRELVICPSCGLIEDVAFYGKLITYKPDDPSMTDTGLSFSFQGKICRCPACGHEFKVEKLED